MDKRIAVLGAGAIGASIGAYLIRAGHDVTIIDQWAAHIEKIRSDGLKLTDLSGEFTVPAKALHLSDVVNLREQFDIVYLSVKSYDTLWSTYFIEPFLKSTGFILPAQNSLNDEAVASVVGFNRTVGCVPSIGVAVYEPGHVIRTDPLTTHNFSTGELSGLITPRVLEIADALKVIGHSEATTNIWGARWAKMVINCMMNTLAGLIGPAITSLNNEQQDTANLIRVVTGCEAVRVGSALGVTVEPIWGIPTQEFVEATTGDSVRTLRDKMVVALGQLRLTPEQIQKLGAPARPSLLQDVIKGRHTEVDYLNGLAVKKGEEVGVPTPMNQAITELMKKLEAGEVKPDPSNLERLKSYLIK
jgi:2-dehydropantoate 2-reductase